MISQKKSSVRLSQWDVRSIRRPRVRRSVTTAEYGVSKAKRPFNSRLDKSKLVENGFEPLPTWQDAVARYLKEIEF